MRNKMMEINLSFLENLMTNLMGQDMAFMVGLDLEGLYSNGTLN